MTTVDIKVKALMSIQDVRTLHLPGSIFFISKEDYDYLSGLKPPRVLRIEEDSIIDELNNQEIIDNENYDDNIASEENKPDDLTLIEGCNVFVAQKLIDSGYKTILDLSIADPNELSKIKGIGKNKALTIVKNAQALIEANR